MGDGEREDEGDEGYGTERGILNFEF